MISVPADALRAAITKARAIALNRSTLPILQTVMLTARPENAWLTLTASSLDAQIALDVECDIDRRIEVCVDAEKFSAAMDVPGDRTKLSIDGERLKVATGRSVFRLPTLPATDFPLMASTGNGVVPFDCGWLVGALARVLPFCAVNDVTRPYLNGPTIASNGAGTITLTASDGFMGAQLVCDASAAAFDVIVPVRVAAMLKSVSPTKAIVKRGEVLFLGENVQLITKLIEGKLPDLGKQFSAPRVGGIKANRKALAAAVKSCCSLADMKIKAARIAVGDNVAVVSAAGNDGSEGRIEVEAAGENFDFGLMDRVALALIESGAGDDVELISTGTAVGVMESGFKAVGMPFRI
jgi:DNA polymerase-3 subunit beta